VNYKDLWNKDADQWNDWDRLGEDEKLEFAAQCERERMLAGVVMPEPVAAYLQVCAKVMIGAPDAIDLRSGWQPLITLAQLQETVAAALAHKNADNLALLKTMVELRAEIERLKTTMDGAVAEAKEQANAKVKKSVLIHEKMMAAAMVMAVAAQREACADLCYQLVDNSRELRFAAAIRTMESP